MKEPLCLYDLQYEPQDFEPNGCEPQNCELIMNRMKLRRSPEECEPL